MDAEIACPVCGATQVPEEDCVACGHPLDGGSDEGIDPDERDVEGFDEDDEDDVPVEPDDGRGG